MEAWGEPIFRWAGSKRKLLPTLLKNIPKDYSRYIEPFCGSACLFFALHPSSALLGDINPELIHAYEIIKKHPKLIQRAASSIPVSEERYLEVRSQNPTDMTDFDRAARFVYLNRYCFNGVYRTNKSGGFNVPMGSKTGRMPNAERFNRCSYALRSAELVKTGYEAVVDRVKCGDFVYLDPPYVKKNGRDRGEYGPNSFTYNDIPTMLKCLEEIDRKGATFLFSYSMEQEIADQLSEKWDVKTIAVKRHVAGFSKHRNIVTEILASNNSVII